MVLQYLLISKFMKGSVTDNTTKGQTSEKGKQGLTKFNNQILNSQSKQLNFLKHKCQTLGSTINYVKKQNQCLKRDKQNLLKLNSEYVVTLNKYYEDRANGINKIIFPSEILSDQFNIDNRLKQYLKKHIQGFKKLECDHRNLVQHCLTMQKQIKNYKLIVDEFRTIKQDLISVNHNDVKQLVKQIKQVSQINKQLRTQNNKIIFQHQKLKLQHQKITKQSSQIQKNYAQLLIQSGQSKGQINKIHQQYKQKISNYQKKIYELNIKSNALQQQLRSDLDEVQKANELKQKHQIQIIQFTHKQTQIKKTLSQYNRLLTTGQSLDETSKQKIGLNTSLIFLQKQNDRKSKRRRTSRSITPIQARRGYC